MWRPLNLMEEPTNFPKLIFSLNEKYIDDNRMYTDKELGLWDINILKNIKF